MLTLQRQELLLTRLAEDGRIVAKSVATELGLSEDTIRRDLRALARAGRLRRVHGGALPASAADADLSARREVATTSKRAVGRAAARLVTTGQVVFIDGGTTALQLVRHLPLGLVATIITHSPTIAVELERHTNLTVIIVGGQLFRHSMVTVGASAIEAVSLIRADTFFMGVTGVDLEAGLSTGDLEEAHVKRALGRSAAETIVLASKEKLGAASAYRVIPLEEASGIVVDGQTSPALVKAFRAKGLTVTKA